VLPPEQYYICATGISSGAPGYWEQTVTPPTLSLSPTTVQAGQTVTISGSSFQGAQSVDVSVQQGTTLVHIQSVSPVSDGTFSVEYTPDGTLTNAVVLVARSPAENGAPPALQASATLSILPSGTATVGTTPSPQATQNPSGQVPPGTGPKDGGNGLLLVVLFTVLGLVVLAGLGVVAFFVLRGRGPAAPALAYPGVASGPGGPGGYATTGRMTGVPGRQTGRPAGYGAADQWDQPAVPQVGAVAGWVDDPRPGPDWRPRPMSGQRRDWDQDTASAMRDDSPTDVSQYWQYENPQREDDRPGGYAPDVAAPPDPWAHQSPGDGLDGGQGVTNPANYPDDEDQWTQLQPGRKRAVPNWHDEPGPGVTRPENQAESQPLQAAEPTDEQPALPTTPATQTPAPVDPTPPAEPE
jgi:hypothetical protein